MTDQDRISIAKEYISRHKNSSVIEWQPIGVVGNEKYLHIYISTYLLYARRGKIR